MPMRRRASRTFLALGSSQETPNTRTLPAAGRFRPRITRMSWVLPLPEPPTSDSTSSRRTCRFRSRCRIVPAPTVLTRPSISMTYSLSGTDAPCAMSAHVPQHYCEDRIEDDDAGDRGNHRARHAHRQAVRIGQHAQPVVAGDESHCEAEGDRLADADPEVRHLDCFGQRLEERPRRDAERELGDQ